MTSSLKSTFFTQNISKHVTKCHEANLAGTELHQERNPGRRQQSQLQETMVANAANHGSCEGHYRLRNLFITIGTKQSNNKFCMPSRNPSQ